jgi:hypothetical protein
MSPTILRDGPYGFLLNSREEPRMHVHVSTADGMAKFRLEPIVALANSHGLKPKELKALEQIIQERRDEFIKNWRAHFER